MIQFGKLYRGLKIIISLGTSYLKHGGRRPIFLVLGGGEGPDPSNIAKSVGSGMRPSRLFDLLHEGEKHGLTMKVFCGKRP